jgi:hypothetical protein
MTTWNEGVVEGLMIARAFTRGQLELALAKDKRGRSESLGHILREIEKVITLERKSIAKQRENAK